MKFTKFPESVTAPPGDKVTFECEVNVPGENFIWRWKPDREGAPWVDVVNGDGRRIVPGLPGRSTKLEIDVKIDIEVSMYQCVIWYGAVSLTSVPARLTIARLVSPPNKVADKRVILAPIYNTIVLHCLEPQSEPPAVLTWWKEGGSKGKRKQLETPHGVLVIQNASTDDSGTYSCRATNELSGDSLDIPQNVHLMVQHETKGDVRFLESEEYVGVKDSEGVLTMPVMSGGSLRLWCGAVGTPVPKISWSVDSKVLTTQGNDQMLMVSPFTPANEGIYSCSAGGIRRSWKVIALQLPHWEGIVTNLNANEGGEAHVTCGNSFGQPPPKVHWVLNAELLKNGKGIKANNTDLFFERVEKRHAGIVQCFACNSLGCSYDAAMLTVMPLQISDQDYPAEIPKVRNPSQTPRRHNRKNPRKHKAVMIPPSRPNVTRLSDESVMVSWSNDNHGLPIQFFKVQYKEVSNSSSVQWNTANQDIPAHIHSYEIDGLTPGKYYKFRIAAVYSNQDNKLGKSSARFQLQRGDFQAPHSPVLVRTTPLSPNTIQLDWTWSSGGGVEAEGFYVYYRSVSSAGAYEKVTAGGGSGARSLRLAHLAPDTSYELKLQAYTAQAASEFSAIKVAKTLRPAAGIDSTSVAPATESPASRAAPGALVTAGGALGAAALIILLAAAFLICRRARRPSNDKEKGSVPESGGANGYIPGKVPITITANPMHSESGDAGVEMSFLHNNNTGNNDDTLPHSRKNGPGSRQYV